MDAYLVYMRRTADALISVYLFQTYRLPTLRLREEGNVAGLYMDCTQTMNFVD